MIITKEFIEWALKRKGYKIHNDVLYFYNFEFSRLEECIQNVQFKLFNP